MSEHFLSINKLKYSIPIPIAIRNLYAEWLERGGKDIRNGSHTKVIDNTRILQRNKRSRVGPGGFGVQANPYNRQPHIPRPHVPLQQMEHYLSQEVGYPRNRIPGSKVSTTFLYNNHTNTYKV